MRAIFTLMVLFLLAGCAVQDTTTAPTQPTSQQPTDQQIVINEKAQAAVQPVVQAAPLEPVVIRIENFKFNPTILTVEQGTEVVWTNTDAKEHTVTLDNLALDIVVAPKESVSFTFDTPGTYDYSCRLHPSMKGTVMVQ